MAKIPVSDALRIIPREAEFLNRKSGLRGEVFYDQTANTLRIYNGSTVGGINLAKGDLSNVSNSDFLSKATSAGVSGGGGGNTTVSVGSSLPASPSSGNLWLDTNTGILYVYFDDGTSSQWIQPVFPYPDLTNLATLSYVNNSVANLASISYVNNAIATFPTEIFNLNIAADDSTQRNIQSGNTIKFIGAGGVTTSSNADGAITITGGGTTGNVTFAVTTIDSSDSSAIRFAPAVIFDSDVTVQNNLVIDNSVDVALDLSVNNRLTVKDIVLTGNFLSQGSGVPELFSDNEIIISPGTTTILNGLTTVYQTTEVINTKTGATGTVVHDLSTGAIFYHSSISANFTVNFTNVPTTNDRTLAVVLVLNQGLSAYLPTVVQIAGAAQTILWQGATLPSGTASRVDVVSFTLIRTGSTWTVIGALTSYGAV